MPLRILMMGTPDFAVPTLQKLDRDFLVCGVICQPDRPSGRGRSLVPPPVKIAALELGLEVFQPVDANAPSALERIKSWKPDLICVAAFGQLLDNPLLELPRYGCLNVHASLLPRWRGASPVNAAILHGDEHTGVTIMLMGPGLDDGPVIGQASTPIDPRETAGELTTRLAELGADQLVKTIPPYTAGKITPEPQDSSLATYAGRLRKKDGQLDFSMPAAFLARQVRAYSPWPGTFTFWNDKRLIIHQARAENVTNPGAGGFTRYNGQPAIGASEGLLVLEKLQLAGRKAQSGREFLNGFPDWPE